MKKLLLALPAILLAVFMSGCSKTPDEELSEKIPASVNSLCLINGKCIAQTKLYKDHEKDILKELKKASLPEDVVQCRVLIFGSTKEEWGGALMQSAGGQVRKIFDKALTECKKDSKKELKESSEGGLRTITGTVEGKKILAVLYHDNLMLIAVGKTDPAFFKAKSVNPLFHEIKLKDSIISAAVKVELPQQGKTKEAVDGALQMVPALQKLQSVAMNVPFAPDKQPEMDFRMVFQDDAAANEMLATVNMGLGFLAQSKDPNAAKIVKMISRKAEKNAVVISFPIDELAKTVEKSVKQGQMKAKRISSVSNLKQIGLACKMYSMDHSEKFPNDLTALEKYLSDAKVYVAPVDERRKASKDKVIRQTNTSYAYVGKGLSEHSSADLPLAFEKPDVVAKHAGVCNVLYVDGHVHSEKVKGRTCKAIAQELTAKLAKSKSNANAKDNARDIAIILANAEAVDLAQ